MAAIAISNLQSCCVPKLFVLPNFLLLPLLRFQGLPWFVLVILNWSKLLVLIQAKRRYATLENPGPDVKKPKNNTLLITVLAAAVAAGGYWYYSESDDLQAEAKAHEEEAKKKAREATEAGKARLEDAYKQGQVKYGEMKASVDKSIQDAEARTKQAAENAQAKLNGYKNDASDSVENLYNDARASTVKKEEQAKEGWFSWLGWGKSKTEDAKKSSAEKVSDAAADVKSKADKHT